MTDLSCEMIDQETGEVLDVEDFTESQIKTLDLPRIARALRSIQGKIENISAYQDEEIDRIQALCIQKIDSLVRQYGTLLSQAEHLYQEIGGDKSISYPGLGKFAIHKGREVVIDKQFIAMTEDERAYIQNENADLFVIRTVVRPDKKAIKEALKSDRQVPGFEIHRSGNMFKFKVE